MFGPSKKKLQAATTQNETLGKDIEEKKAELARLQTTIENMDNENKALAEKVAMEIQRKNMVEGQNDGLKKELGVQQSKTEELRRKIDEAKLSLDSTRKEKEELHARLGSFEGLVKEQHESAKKSAELAQRESQALREEQEKERQVWHETKSAHEELLRQSELDSQRIAQAQKEFEEAKKEHTAARDALQDLQKAHERLCADHELNQRSLEEKQEKCTKLEAEISDIERQVREAIQAREELEAGHREKNALLSSAAADLAKKQDFLQRELSNFDQQFQEAKGCRERLLGETDRVRNDMGAFLPEYFNLQTEHAQNQRESEKIKRQTETLQWEHHKVHRDLHMLAKSYDAGYLASLSPATS